MVTLPALSRKADLEELVVAYNNLAAVLNAGIDSANLAANAVNGVTAFGSGAAFSSAVTATWLTVVSTGTIACSGAPLRLDLSFSPTHSVGGGVILCALGQDGSVVVAMQQVTVPVAGGYEPVSWSMVFAPVAGNHSFELMLFNGTAGTIAVPSGYSHIYATEQKR